MRKKKLPFLFLSLVLVVFSCKKNDSPPPVTPKVTTGVYTLDQGNYGHNNTALTYYDFTSGTPATDFFKSVNGFGLGDTGSDFIIYGGKVYIVMNVSGYVAVSNSSNAKFIDTINFKNAGVNRGPENIIAYGTNVFVSSSDGTVAVIDTTTLTIGKFITVGTNPAQMAVSGSNLYVSNTGAISGNYDSTLSVIDLTALAETGKITVGINPGSIAGDSSGNIFVACTGDYISIAPTLVKVSVGTGKVILTVDSIVGSIRYYNNTLLTTGGYLGAANTGILNTSDLTAVRSSFVTDGTVITNPYGLDVDPATGDLYVCDAKDYSSSGEVFCFDKNGKQKFNFSTTPGISPIRTQLVIK
jgi:YVTN family beta-propeller protein